LDRATAYLIRHGETAQNVGRVYRGRADVPLNDTGVGQAARLAAVMADREIGAVYSSPLSRAVATARPLAERLGITLDEDPAFLDIDYGSWTGRPAEDVERDEPELSRLWHSAPHEVTFREGGSLAEVRDRAWPRLVALAESHPGGAFVVVTHRVVLKVLLGEAAGAGIEALWRIKVDTASVSQVDFNSDGPAIVRTNEPSAAGSATGDF
jgi:probable phosphoglycerate mutase